ncbi:hypothetical protein Cgig2_007366 [Carnegiea gigantea]|uniref:F-box domain-containing protein n=1 Tax=Carnegiea gigantea TaxID=171969 RepID=A0A9Q1GG06_9CARY|nr:hypothetical protein Cgig2_002634 [Carnegiea gigantea]KAJ8451883.1 hypothetical protein Cgig2_007366 [Carnegiea gigantea]
MASSVQDVPSQKMYIMCERKAKARNNCKDIISSLMDDILVRILSLLDLREAARTSALSKRWRYLWANRSDLDFDASPTLYRLWHELSISWELYDAQCEFEAYKFVRHVNQVVSSNLAPSINRFRVRFLLGGSYGYDIHRWVNFAMGKNVKELELNLSSYIGGYPQYPFCLYSFRCYAGYPSVHSLVSLSLVAVNICGYFLKSVLFTFPNLERLTLKDLGCGQSDLIVVGDSLKLRHLEISRCRDCRKLEISARNLNSIVYYAYGHEQDVKFAYAPLLNEASVSGPNSVRFIHRLHHSGSLHQLTKLAGLVQIQDFIRSPIGFPQFVNLKQLEFAFSDAANQSLLIFTNLIDACPVLHNFKLQRDFRKSYWFDDEEALRGNVIKVAEKYHHCLRIFEMVGFRGAPADFELVMYLARFAIVFEKVVLDPHLPWDEGKPSERNTLEQIEAIRRQAKLLQNQLPARVQMEVL